MKTLAIILGLALTACADEKHDTEADNIPRHYVDTSEWTEVDGQSQSRSLQDQQQDHTLRDLMILHMIMNSGNHTVVHEYHTSSPALRMSPAATPRFTRSFSAPSAIRTSSSSARPMSVRSFSGGRR